MPTSTYQCDHCGGIVESTRQTTPNMQCPTCGAEMDKVDYAGQDTEPAGDTDPDAN